MLDNIPFLFGRDLQSSHNPDLLSTFQVGAQRRTPAKDSGLHDVLSTHDRRQFLHDVMWNPRKPLRNSRARDSASSSKSCANAAGKYAFGLYHTCFQKQSRLIKHIGWGSRCHRGPWQVATSIGSSPLQQGRVAPGRRAN